MRNLLTDVTGILVGNAHDQTLCSGVTVILCKQPTVAGVSAPGGAPGNREIELLRPECLVEHIDALVFSGGSSFGLAAASAVTTELATQGRGFKVGEHRVPIVPSAILFDLFVGDKPTPNKLPYATLGQQALANAGKTFQLGNQGAGMGASCGELKGGLGSSSYRLGEFTVASLSAVNAHGSALIPGSPVFWAWPLEQQQELGDQRRLLKYLPAPPLDLNQQEHSRIAAANTTLAVVATDARLTKTQATRLAIMAQSGFARALRPVFTPFDGDIVFALATGTIEATIDPATLAQLGSAAADCLARSIARAVYCADSLASLPGYRQSSQAYH